MEPISISLMPVRAPRFRNTTLRTGGRLNNEKGRPLLRTGGLILSTRQLGRLKPWLLEGHNRHQLSQLERGLHMGQQVLAERTDVHQAHSCFGPRATNHDRTHGWLVTVLCTGQDHVVEITARQTKDWIALLGLRQSHKLCLRRCLGSNLQWIHTIDWVHIYYFLLSFNG